MYWHGFSVRKETENKVLNPHPKGRRSKMNKTTNDSRDNYHLSSELPVHEPQEQRGQNEPLQEWTHANLDTGNNRHIESITVMMHVSSHRNFDDYRNGKRNTNKTNSRDAPYV